MGGGTAAGSGFGAEHTALTSASRSLPGQASVLDGIHTALTANEVPSSAFAGVDGSQTASAGHRSNLLDGVQRMKDAALRLRGTGDGVRGANDAYQAFDQDRATAQDDEAAPILLARNDSGAVSQNGWPVDPARSAQTIPGTNTRLTVAEGDAGEVLMHVAGQFNSRVEGVEGNTAGGEQDDWGYANRPIRGSTTVSNHASATAIDLNSTNHPLGDRGTFQPAQVDTIHTILGEVDNVVRWGGDYHGRVDEMHFEINATPEQVAAVAARLRGAH